MHLTSSSRLTFVDSGGLHMGRCVRCCAQLRKEHLRPRFRSSDEVWLIRYDTIRCAIAGQVTIFFAFKALWLLRTLIPIVTATIVLHSLDALLTSGSNLPGTATIASLVPGSTTVEAEATCRRPTERHVTVQLTSPRRPRRLTIRVQRVP